MRGAIRLYLIKLVDLTRPFPREAKRIECTGPGVP